LVGLCLRQKRTNHDSLGLEEVSARHRLTYDPASRYSHFFLKPKRGWLTLAGASQVSTAIACLRGKARRLNAVTLDDEFEPGPQYGFLSWPHRHHDPLLKPLLSRESG
jgi:hypothetical protein